MLSNDWLMSEQEVPPTPPNSSSQSESASDDENEEEYSAEIDHHKKVTPKSSRDGLESWIDDGIEEAYLKRLSLFEEQKKIRKDKRSADIDDDIEIDKDGEDAYNCIFYDAEEEEDVILSESGCTLPAYINANLFEYQRTCVTWLWELHHQNAGGIVGDEMGLGKTIQIIAFMASLFHKKMISRCLIVCPTSVLLHWVKEFHKWYPSLRVVLFHSSGTALSCFSRQEIIDIVADRGGVLLTTYEAVRQHQEMLLNCNWDYVILDEGHRIRNPDAEVTLVCKQFKTPHRLILTGAPIQNHLRELWSLFDFVFPGRLGTLPSFEDEFVLPIRSGGYAKASRMQVIMAYKCALTLRDLINPYLLRRLKKDLKEITKLPKKTELVLFCKLSDRQRSIYKSFLGSSELQNVLTNQLMPFRAISILRKICNYPFDAQEQEKKKVPLSLKDCQNSGKIAVLQTLLPLLKEQEHRVLLFTQTRRMLDILEWFISQVLGYLYCRIDGTTPAKNRQLLIDRFNRDKTVFIFLLTTRAGGVGINLMGADRVIVYDPDWNPSTDIQARERAWRLGQKRPVTIYRLITSGTIEEKIYHRQIYKQYLTNKILKDPKQRRCFNELHLRDLFTLNDQKYGTETGDLFIRGQVRRPSYKEQEHHQDEEEHQLLKNKLENITNIEPCNFKVRQQEEGEEQDSVEEEQDEQDKNQNKSIDEDDNATIMQKLFDGADIQSMFSHDALESEGIHSQETVLMEMESEKIAKEAVANLFRSRKKVEQSRLGIHQPTWTGKSGSAGVPLRFGTKINGEINKRIKLNPNTNDGENNRVCFDNKISGFSSSSSLQQQKKRLSSTDLIQKINQRETCSQRSTSFLPSVTSKYKPLAKITLELHDLLEKNNIQGTSTEDILSQFADSIAPRDKLAFRQILREISYLKGKKWRLKTLEKKKI